MEREAIKSRLKDTHCGNCAFRNDEEPGFCIKFNEMPSEQFCDHWLGDETTNLFQVVRRSYPSLISKELFTYPMS